MALFKKKPMPSPLEELLEREVRTIEELLANYAVGDELPFGSPTRCPRCATTGYVTAVNQLKGVTDTTCLSCNISWVVTRRALEEHRRRNPMLRAEPLGRLDPARQALETVEEATQVGAVPSELELPKGRPLQLLIVEDNPDDAVMIESILKPVTPDGVQTAHVATRHEGESAAKLGFDVVLLDLNLPESEGMTTLKAFRDACPEPPLCVCSGHDHLEQDWRSYAQQSLPKRELPRLLSSNRSGSFELLDLLHTTVATPLATA